MKRKTESSVSFASVVQARSENEKLKKRILRPKSLSPDGNLSVTNASNPASNEPNQAAKSDDELVKRFQSTMATMLKQTEDDFRLPYPYLAGKVFFCLEQTTFPRSWCIKLVTNKWFDRFTMLVILLNCVLMGLYRPCEDEECTTTRCKSLEIADYVIFGYFALEMLLKMLVMGIFGRKTYLSDSWNRLDCFIVVAGGIQYVLESQLSGDINLTVIRTIRVLRPLRAVNRISSLRVVVTLLLDTLPMVANVLVLCAFVFFVFGIVAVHLWKGALRNRCVIGDTFLSNYSQSFLGVEELYWDHGNEYLCSLENDHGIHTCKNLPPTARENMTCNESVIAWSDSFIVLPKDGWDSCINWNQYYNKCAPTEYNPINGAISFDNIASGWLTIFIVISLEGWSDIMYFIQDSQSFWAWIYFVILIVIGSFFMINLFLVVISCQFGETRKRETARMLKERKEALKNTSNEEWDDIGDDGQVDSYGMYEICIRTIYKTVKWSIYKFKTEFFKFRPKPQSHVSRESVHGNQVSRGIQTTHNKLLQLIKLFARETILGNKFRSLIIVAIFINTVALALEHHNQPASWTEVLEICNLVFTVFFAIEMVLKLYALGIYEYFIDPFNFFDAVIVIMSIIDATQPGEGQGLSVLRTFRLLRIIKLIRFMPALRHQLGIMIEVLDEVAVFFVLMVLFVFIFSLMGMVLFGGQFCSHPDGSACNCNDIINGTVCLCDRKNFDTFMNASLTVFQILTTEDWNEVLFNGMERTSHWASIYFVILMTIGNYILLNLLVAILVDGVQQQQDKERMEQAAEKEKETKKEDRRRASSKALIPSAETCTSLPLSRSDPPKLSSRSCSEANSINDDVFFSACAGPEFACTTKSSEKSLIWHDASSEAKSKVTFECPVLENFRRDNWERSKHLDAAAKGNCYKNHLGKPSAEDKCQQTGTNDRPSKDSCELAVIEKSELPFSGMKAPVTNAVNLWKKTLREPQNPPVYAASKTYQNQTSKSLKKLMDLSDSSYSDYLSSYTWYADTLDAGPKDPLTIRAYNQVHGCCCTVSRIYKKSSCHKQLGDRAFFICTKNSIIRAQCLWLVKQKWFDNGILCLIFLNCITMAMERPDIRTNSIERRFLNISNYIFTVLFLFEMLIKIVAYGLLCGKDTYTKSGWNVMDGLLAVSSSINCIFTLIQTKNAPEIFNVLRVFRILRALRPLRVINRAPGLKLTVQSLMASFKDIANVLLICFVFFIIFGILGVQLFKGVLYHCEGTNIENVTNKAECLAVPGNQWINARFNYDDLGQALLTLFVMSTLDGWVVMMHQGIDAVGVDQQPQLNYSQLRILYFVVFLLVVGFFILNMFVGVLVENFHEVNDRLKKEAIAKKLLNAQAKLTHGKPDKQKSKKPVNKRNKYAIAWEPGPFRLKMRKMVNHNAVQLFILLAILLNVIGMATVHYQMSEKMEFILEICNYTFTAIFTLEAALKIFALTFCGYISDWWNRIDLVIVVVSVMGVAFELVFVDQGIIPINPGIIRLLRVIRIFRGVLLFLKLLKSAKGIRCLLETVSKALPQVGNLGVLFFLLFFIFAALGVELFGRIECSLGHPCDGLGEHAHFENLGMAFLTLFRISTGDNWNGILKDTLRQDCNAEPDCEKNCCISSVMATLFFVSFVLLAQFVLLNVVVAMLMKGFEESEEENSSDNSTIQNSTSSPDGDLATPAECDENAICELFVGNHINEKFKPMIAQDSLDTEVSIC